MKKHPNQNVLAWFELVPSNELYISILTVGEIRKGIEKTKEMNKKNKLIIWLEHAMSKWFGNNILPINFQVAERGGYLCGESKNTLPTIDSLLTATALVHNLKLVTRNEKDFLTPGLEVINPFI